MTVISVLSFILILRPPIFHIICIICIICINYHVPYSHLQHRHLAYRKRGPKTNQANTPHYAKSIPKQAKLPSLSVFRVAIQPSIHSKNRLCTRSALSIQLPFYQVANRVIDLLYCMQIHRWDRYIMPDT